MPVFYGKPVLLEIHEKGRVLYDMRLADGTDEEIIQAMDDEYFDSGWRIETKDPMKKGKAVLIILDEGGKVAKIYNREVLKNFKISGCLEEPIIINNPAWLSGHLTGNKCVGGTSKKGAGQPIGWIRTAIHTDHDKGTQGLDYRFLFPDDIDGYEFSDTQSFRNEASKALGKLAADYEKHFHCKCLSTGNLFDPDGNLYSGGIHLWMRDMDIEEVEIGEVV